MPIHVWIWLKSKILTTSNSGEAVEHQELSLIACEYKMIQPLWKTVGQFLTKLNILLPYDIAITLLGIYSNELKTYLHKNLHPDVYSNSIYNSQNLEESKMSLSK